MLTDTVIKVTFGDFRAQQIRVLFSSVAHYITQSSTFLHCLFIDVREKIFTIKMYIENLNYITYNG